MKKKKISFGWLKKPFFYVFTTSVIFLCFTIITGPYHTTSGELARGLLYPLATNFSNEVFSNIIIDYGLTSYALMTFCFPYSVIFTFMYFVIEVVYAKKVTQAAIPFLISIVSLLLIISLIDPQFFVPTSPLTFYQVDPQTEIALPVLNPKIVQHADLMSNCHSLELPQNFPESETLRELDLPVEIAKLSVTGKTYYRKYKGQTEFYFPQEQYKNSYELGLLYLSNNDTSNIKQLNTVFYMRCNWHETFGKRISEGNKL